MRTAILAAITLVFTASQSMALDCKDIRAAVRMVGKERAVQIAREAGASDGAISNAMACLSGRRR